MSNFSEGERSKYRVILRSISGWFEILSVDLLSKGRLQTWPQDLRNLGLILLGVLVGGLDGYLIFRFDGKGFHFSIPSYV